MSAVRLAIVERALQNVLTACPPTNDMGKKAREEAVAALADRQIPRHQWLCREELLDALARVDTVTARQLEAALKKEPYVPAEKNGATAQIRRGVRSRS